MRWLLSGAAAVAVALGGCAGQEIKPASPYCAQAEGLLVGLEIPKTSILRGETVTVGVVAVNLTDKPIAIHATTGAPVHLSVWRSTGIGWEMVKRYPRAATMVMTTWTLAPRAQRRFEMNLTVEPDWPTHEPLRLTAELNGRDDVVAAAPITVVSLPPAAQ